ncbi:MAG: methyltransferase domain-containing protein [Chloroflexi bacterium]|nr:methyltransferase domain-containing protein [Chloroflexota bacterium]
MPDSPSSPPVCDYEGSSYRTDFWEGQGRDYEDRVERIAIQRLMPQGGRRLIQLGAAFGRLTPLFEGYEQIVLLDYSRSQLEEARREFGDTKYRYVAANIYNMPFVAGLFDGLTMIRVLHHMQDPAAALAEVRRIGQSGGAFLLEFANKRNLKAIGRWLLRQQDWNPFDLAPVEFVELNFDFHPQYVRQTLHEVGFAPGRSLTVSHFRVDLLKRSVPTGLLVAVDSLFQWTGGVVQVSPSVFVRSAIAGKDEPAPDGAFWRCPSCGGHEFEERSDRLVCQSCGAQWAIVNGVYDFKTPISA